VLATAGVGLAVLSPDTAHAAGGKVNWDAVRKDVVAVRVYRHSQTEFHGRGLLGPWLTSSGLFALCGWAFGGPSDH
jgi:hypothetical protein